MNESLKIEAWSRLRQGESLTGLSLAMIGGPIDLRGLSLRKPVPVHIQQFGHFNVGKLLATEDFRQVKLIGLDFTGSQLPSIRFYGAEIRNCLFDDCKMADLRMWSTVVADSSFRCANLRGASLGGIDNGKRNRFLGADFSGADMRETGYKSASFEGCLFRRTRLEKTNFQGTNFADCRFEGEVRDVIFNRLAYKGEEFPPNEMVSVDFSRAQLRYVDFRGLTMDRVLLPQDKEHVVLKNYAYAMDKILGVLREQEDSTAKKLVFVLENSRKWVVPNQVQGVINK